MDAPAVAARKAWRHWLTIAPAGCRDRLGLHCDRVIVSYGRNDLTLRSQAGDSVASIVAAIQAGIQSLVRQVCGRGRHLAVTTILPTPGSDDGWTSAAAMKPISATYGTPAQWVAEQARVALNLWLRDTSAAGCAAQAAGWIAALGTGAKLRIIDICTPIETNQAGALAANGGCLLVSPATVYDSGTATSGNNITINDTSKAWAVNAFRGRQVWISAGTGRYASGVVQYNTATQLRLLNAFSGGAVPDATSQYRIVDAPTADATHPTGWGNAVIAAGIRQAVDEFMAL
jgi:hypothetical protein